MLERLLYQLNFAFITLRNIKLMVFYFLRYVFIKAFILSWHYKFISLCFAVYFNNKFQTLSPDLLYL